MNQVKKVAETAVSLSAEEIRFLLDALPQMPMQGKAKDLDKVLTILNGIVAKLELEFASHEPEPFSSGPIAR